MRAKVFHPVRSFGYDTDYHGDSSESPAQRGHIPVEEVIMLKIVLAVMLLVMPFGLSACDKAYMATMEKMGYAKRDILSSRVKSARDAQEDAKKEIQTTLEQFGQVVSYDGGDLESTYKKLNGELENSEDGAKTVRKKIADVESVADALFSEWETELGQYSNADLRRKSQTKLTQTKGRYREMLSAMKRAEQRIEPVLKPLRDQVLYLKHNLNARALAAIKGELVKVDAQVDQLVKDMNRSIAEADKFIQSMEKESD